MLHLSLIFVLFVFHSSPSRADETLGQIFLSLHNFFRMRFFSRFYWFEETETRRVAARLSDRSRRESIRIDYSHRPSASCQSSRIRRRRRRIVASRRRYASANDRSVLSIHWRIVASVRTCRRQSLRRIGKEAR